MSQNKSHVDIFLPFKISHTSQKLGTTWVYFKPWEQVNIRAKSESYRKSFSLFQKLFC